MSRERFDVLFDNIVTRLESYATAQAGIEISLGFRVIPDNMRAIGENQYPAWVLPRIDRLTFDAEQSAVGQEWGVTAAYALDCIVRSGASNKRAGEEAGKRLRYLITQVVRALWNRDDWMLGMSSGEIHRAVPTVDMIPPETIATEKAIVGATVTLEASMTWQILGAAGEPFESLHVDAGRFEALYEYGGH